MDEGDAQQPSSSAQAALPPPAAPAAPAALAVQEAEGAGEMQAAEPMALQQPDAVSEGDEADNETALQAPKHSGDTLDHPSNCLSPPGCTGVACEGES